MDGPWCLSFWIGESPHLCFSLLIWPSIGWDLVGIPMCRVEVPLVVGRGGKFWGICLHGGVGGVSLFGCVSVEFCTWPLFLPFGLRWVGVKEAARGEGDLDVGGVGSRRTAFVCGRGCNYWDYLSCVLPTRLIRLVGGWGLF